MNVKKHQILFFFILIIILSTVQASEFYLIKYKVKNGDTISKIFRSFIKDNLSININTPFVQKTIKSNSHIKKWANLPPETLIQLYITDDFIDLNKFNTYKENILNNLSNNKSTKNSITKKYHSPSIKKLSLFFMSSFGKFTQESSSIGKINFDQNSPYSIGSSFTLFPADKTYSYSFSAYYSYLKAGVSSGASSSIHIPAEFGSNAYFEYRWKPNGLAVYSGPDYEAFSAFSNSGLSNLNFYIDRIGMLYWTLGIANTFIIFNKPFYFKLQPPEV